MRSRVLRPAAALIGVVTGVAALASPADAATATVLYRTNRNPAVSTPGRTCSNFPGNPPLTAELSTSLRVGGQNPNANSRLIVCATSSSSTYLFVSIASTIAWSSSRSATAQHVASVSEVDFNTFKQTSCTPTIFDPQNRIRIASGQQGTVTSEFAKRERYVSATRSVTCPTLGRRTVTVSFTEGWSAVA